MIDKDVEIIPGMVVRHDDGGLMYRVEDARRSTENYEKDHKLGGLVVNYIQLEEGSFPIGTQWNKDEASFRQFFTCV